MKATPTQKLLLGMGLLIAVSTVAILAWLERPIQAPTATANLELGSESRAVASLTPARHIEPIPHLGGPASPLSDIGPAKAAESNPPPAEAPVEIRASQSIAAPHRVEPRQVAPASVSLPPPLPQHGGVVNAAGDPPLRSVPRPAPGRLPQPIFRVAQYSDGLDIDFDARASIPAIFAPEVPEPIPQTQAQITHAANAEVTARDENLIWDAFIRDVSASPTRSQTLDQWEDATDLANERYRVRLGRDRFMDATRRAAKQFERTEAR